jgi:hypothetical protein
LPLVKQGLRQICMEAYGKSRTQREQQQQPQPQPQPQPQLTFN